MLECCAALPRAFAAHAHCELITAASDSAPAELTVGTTFSRRQQMARSGLGCMQGSDPLECPLSLVNMLLV
jgi:hypothetical protein